MKFNMNSLQQALAKFKPPFRYCEALTSFFDASDTEIIEINSPFGNLSVKEIDTIGNAIADFLNQSVKKTDAEI